MAFNHAATGLAVSFSKFSVESMKIYPVGRRYDGICPAYFDFD
jgi:hypothetical protein